jgi:hypothetical protein
METATTTSQVGCSSHAGPIDWPFLLFWLTYFSLVAVGYGFALL